MRERLADDSTQRIEHPEQPREGHARSHRHVTTTEIYLHYAPDENAAARLSSLWGDDGADPEPTAAPGMPAGEDGPAVGADRPNAIPLRRAA